MDESIERARAEVDEASRVLAEKRQALRNLESVQARLLGLNLVSPRAAAGPALISAVRGVLSAKPMRAADITRAVGKNSGSVTYALRALVEEGAAVVHDDGRVRRYAAPIAGRRRAVV